MTAEEMAAKQLHAKQLCAVRWWEEQMALVSEFDAMAKEQSGGRVSNLAQSAAEGDLDKTHKVSTAKQTETIYFTNELDWRCARKLAQERPS